MFYHCHENIELTFGNCLVRTWGYVQNTLQLYKAVETLEL
jgi:hypothetical protein